MGHRAVVVAAPHPAARTTARAVRATAVAAIVITAAVGVLVAGWLAFSAASGARVIVFATGSMSPTYPQGSAAVSVPVAASDLAVGDVVTVRREGMQRPVTHRVVAVSAAPGDELARELVLQGDGNEVPDVAPYVVREAHRVTWGSAALGVVARTLRGPVARAGLWAGAAGAVLWAMWPARIDKEDDDA